MSLGAGDRVFLQALQEERAAVDALVVALEACGPVARGSSRRAERVAGLQKACERHLGVLNEMRQFYQNLARREWEQAEGAGGAT